MGKPGGSSGTVMLVGQAVFVLMGLHQHRLPGVGVISNPAQHRDGPSSPIAGVLKLGAVFE